MYSYQYEGYNLYKIGDYENAAIAYSKALEIANKIYSSTDLRLADSYMNLGVIYMLLWDYNYSLELLSIAEDIYTNSNPNHIHIGSVAVNKGIIFRKMRNYERAITFYNHAINVFKNQRPIDYESLRITYGNLAYVYEQSENYEKAIELYNHSILYDKHKSKQNLLVFYSILAWNYSKLGLIELAEENYKKAILLSKQFVEAEENINVVDVYMNYGVFQMDYRRNLDYAKELFFTYIRKLNETNIKNTEALSVAYHNIGEVYYNYFQIDSALYYFQKSLNTAITSFQDSNIYSNPNIDLKSEQPRVLNTLKFKAKSFKTKYLEKGNLNDYKFSLQTYLLIYDLINQMRLMYDSENSSFLISQQEDETFISGIIVAEELYAITSDEKYLEIAFQINEKRKSFTLLTSIRKTEAKDFGGIPLTLLNQERELYNRIAAYEELIFEEKKKNRPDQGKMDNWEELRFATLKNYDELVATFESEFPEYYRLKYDASTRTIEQIKAALKPDEVLIEYVVTDSSLHTFLIDKNSSEISIRSVDSAFRINIDYLRNYLSNPQFSDQARKNYNDYCNTSYDLYTELIDPFSDKIDNKSLVIVPDGLLWYIPFEALITSPINGSEIDYRNLPYLIRENPISYTYSATLHFEENRRNKIPTKELLAIAPDYSNLYSQVPAKQDFLEAYRDNLMPIPGVKDEVRMISRLIPGDVLIGEEASESRFKEVAGDYNILHLAMHTVVNNEDPMYSKLAFQQKIDDGDDGFLNTYEIYNMRYNARMAVLSSCNTGYGKLMKGEGVMSLARGFMYAGCPSIVMTLWEVSDKSGARLMQDFYKYLKKGKTKSQALQQAKLDFLSKADNLKANPYFWSTYVIIGDPEALYPSKMRSIYWITALLVISVIVIIGFFRRSNKKEEKDNFKTDSIYS